MQVNQTFKEQIHQANIEVHKHEAQYYQLLHPEVYSRKEQKRITSKLAAVTAQISGNQKRALDVGAGTGNLTGKLLKLGYSVTATDISPEMCSILEKKYASYLPGKLTVINSPIEELSFEAESFDLVSFYSVLHHLPDYVAALHTLCGYLRRGGVVYIDHEASPAYWRSEHSGLTNLVKDLYFHSNPIINGLYFQLTGLHVPNIDYTLSDFWHKKDHAINHQAIAEVFHSEGFSAYQRTDYYQTATWTPNPLFPMYRLLCQPEMSYWIAKK
ncbi:MAG: class I SAM-dependent methyltransferase [Candidatus Bathyarchaeota archaeon]|nr:class I SAM-dependent methyltransferase [Candidatus Bathyarchaeota archaeon]